MSGVAGEKTWRDIFEMLTRVDTFILGRVMYPGYEQHWLAVDSAPNHGAQLPRRHRELRETKSLHAAAVRCSARFGGVGHRHAASSSG